MIPNMNLSEAKRETIEPGGYVVRVLRTNIDMQYNRLQLEVDIAEGERAGYFARLQERANFWGLTANLSLNDADRWKFRNAIEAFRKSNPGFQWEDDAENDEHNMIGMYVGAICRKRHYMGNDGKKKSSLQVHHLEPIDVIHSGNFEIPEDAYANDYPREQPAPNRVVDTTAPAGFTATDDDTPF